jgi:hypothetical protein
MRKLILSLLVAVGLIGSASSAVVTGIGSGNIGYPSYSGQYQNITLQFLMPSLNINEYFDSAELTIDYGFNRGMYQEYSNGRQMKVTLGSMQQEQWFINSNPNQEYKFSLNSDILSNITASSGSTLYATVDLILPSGFDRFTQSAFTTIDSSQINLTVVPEPSTYALFGLGALAMIVAYRRKTA